MILDTLLVLSLVVSGFFMAALGLYGRKFAARIPAALPYSLLMGAAAAWAFLYALGLPAGSLPLKILFHNLRFLFVAFIPFLELWLVIAYVRKTAWLRRDRALVLLVIPVLVSILALTSPFHTLFQYNFSVDSSGPVQVLQYQEAPFYLVYLLYSLVILVAAYFVLINESRKQGTLGEIRTVLLLIALILPTVINYLFVAGISLVPGVNMTPILLWIPAILYTMAIFRYQFLDIVPIARDRLIETMNTPMLVLDREGRIMDDNPAARSLFPTQDSAMRGKHIEEVVRDWPEFLEMCRSEKEGTFHLARAGELGTRSYVGSVDLVRTPGGEPEGCLVILRDMTDQIKTEDALHESERKYLALYRDAGVGLFEIRLPGATIVAYNRMFADLFGFTSPEEAAGQDMGGFYVEPSDQDRMSRQLLEAGLIERQVMQFHNKKTGNVFWGQFTLRADREREVAEGIIVDITKQHEAEEQVRHIASFPQLNPDLILEVDRSGTVLFANPAMEEALRESPDPRVFIPSGCLDQVNRDRPTVRTQWKSEIAFVGRTYEETIYYTPEFDTLRIYASDITEKKQAEDALHWTNAYLRNLLDHANAPIIVWDPGFTITRFNHAFERLTGRTEQEVLGQRLDILFPEESTDASLALIEKTLKGERWETVEIPILHRDGSRRIVLWNSATIYATDGTTVLATIAQGQDITRMKAALATVQESERRYRSLFENLLNGFSYCRMIWQDGEPVDFTYLVVNHAFGELTGLREVEGKNISEVVPGIREADPRLFEIYGRVASTGIPERFEMFVESMNEWFSVSVYSPQDGYFVSIFDVITDRKQAEDTLRKTGDMLKMSQEAAHVGSWDWDMRTETLNWSEEFFTLFGLPPGTEPAFAVWLSVLHPDDREPALARINQSIQERKQLYNEYRVITPDGLTRWIGASGNTTYNEHGQPVRMSGICMDITDRKQAEEARESLLTELEQKNAELERFTYTVSHDLKSPLITIRGFLGLLREDALNGDIHQIDQDIIRISSATEKMQELLSDLLTLSRVGRIASPPERVNLGKIAQEARELLAGTIQEHGITLTIAPDLPDVFVDQTRIREVLTNLIENAIKFRGGQEPRVDIGVHYDEGHPVFYVRDNGIGIEPEYLTRIFGLFEKLDPKSEGTGIGLAIVKRIIEVHGGKIWVESAGPGQGTTFWFTLPPGDNRR
jgi:PAS domain S-box-containing protein